MSSDLERQNRLNKLYSICANMEASLLERNKIFFCSKCHGTGLLGVMYHSSGIAWNGVLCEECNGIGYIIEDIGNIEVSSATYLCKKCFGVGCRFCDYSGFVDWIRRLRGVYDE